MCKEINKKANKQTGKETNKQNKRLQTNPIQLDTFKNNKFGLACFLILSFIASIYV
jgi:hypothetical protein